MRAVRATVLALCAVAGCRGTLSPLSNRLKVGEEAYVVFVADGEEGRGDLFASKPAGGTAFQITFTRLDERAPALSPDGATVAFLRSPSADAGEASLVFLNLLNGAERRTGAPPNTTALRWSRDGRALLLQAGAGLMRAETPPLPLTLTPVPSEEQAGTDSLFRVLLGDPPVGEARPCAGGGGVCAWLAGGDTLQLSRAGEGALAWGSDSVAFFENGALVVRPLGGGRTRTIRWTGAVDHPRQATWFPGIPVPRDSALH